MVVLRRRPASLAIIGALISIAWSFGLKVVSAEFGLRIIGGSTVAQKKYPWMVSLQRKSGNTYIHYCGGSLIHPKYVVTAAHCAKSKPDRVRIMQYSLSGPVEAGAVTTSATSVISPSSSSILISDIALVVLSSEVKNIPILPISRSASIESPGQKLTVIGWGVTETKPDVASDTLQEVDVSVVSNKQCNNVYGTIVDKHICAGDPAGGKDSCAMDSGGPLFYSYSGQDGTLNFALVGIVSRGSLECGAVGYPGIYTRASSFYDWIKNNVGDTLDAGYTPPKPTKMPTTKFPTKAPTKFPTKTPTKVPTRFPTKTPTKFPTKAPTRLPTKSPTKQPTEQPTRIPTFAPNAAGCKISAGNPGYIKSETECEIPFYYENGSGRKWFDYPPLVSEATPYGVQVLNVDGDLRWCPVKGESFYVRYGENKKDWGVVLCSNPSLLPTFSPTFAPTPPTKNPTFAPSRKPTNKPTYSPTLFPSKTPTLKPTTAHPTLFPTNSPTPQPSYTPTLSPTTSVPTGSPTNNPTSTEFGIRDALCRLKNDVRECMENNWSNNSCTFSYGVCRAAYFTTAPSQSPTPDPTASPTRQPTYVPTYNGDDLEASSSSSGKTKVMALSISGGVTAAVAAGLLAAGAFVAFRRRANQKRDSPESQENLQISNPTFTGGGGNNAASFWADQHFPDDTSHQYRAANKSRFFPQYRESVQEARV